MSILGNILVLVGALFAFLGALGLLRLPDLYTRLHASSKTGPLGVGLILLGAGLCTGDPWTILRSLIGLVFLILVGPVSTHLLAHSSVRAGIQPSSSLSINELHNSR